MDRDLLELAFDRNTRIGKIFHIPSMTVDAESVDDALEEFLDDMDEQTVAMIEPHCEGFAACYAEALSEFEQERTDNRSYAGQCFRESLTSYLARYLKLPFIIQIQHQIVDYHRRGEEFPLGSMRSGWGYFMNEWVVAESIEDALKQGIVISEASMRESWDKAAPYDAPATTADDDEFDDE